MKDEIVSGRIEELEAEIPAEASPLTRMQRAVIEASPRVKVDVEALAEACLAVAEAMVEEAVTNARSNGRDELSTTKLAYAKEIDTLKARITEMEVEANEDRKIKKDQKREVAELERKLSFALQSASEFEKEMKGSLDLYSHKCKELDGYELEIKGLQKELSETRAIYNRMASEFEVAKRDAAHFRTRTATAEEHARKLYDVIESLASIGRNL